MRGDQKLRKAHNRLAGPGLDIVMADCTEPNAQDSALADELQQLPSDAEFSHAAAQQDEEMNEQENQDRGYGAQH